MSVARDKLGEFVLVAEEFNRYEEFAALPGNYATVDEDAKSVSAPGKFDLYYEQSLGLTAHKDRRVLVRSDRVYGVRRRIARLIFDVVCADSLWAKSKTVTSFDGVVAEGYDASLRARVRPVTAEFDPAEVTWASAYEGESPLTFGDPAEAMLALHGAVLSANQQNPYGAATAAVSESGVFPALLVFRRDEYGQRRQGTVAVVSVGGRQRRIAVRAAEL